MNTAIALVSRCAVCSSSLREQINRRMAEGMPDTRISAWLDSEGAGIGRNLLGRHRKTHLTTERTRVAREVEATIRAQQKVIKPPKMSDLARLVRDQVIIGVDEGSLVPTVAEGLRAQEILDRRTEKDADRDLMIQIAQLLGGSQPIEGTFREIDYPQLEP